MIFFKLLLLIIFFALPSFAQDVPSQKSIAIKAAKKYFLTFPELRAENLLHSVGWDDFQFFRKLHEQNPAKSPFRIFQANANRNVPSLEWSFPFGNSGSEFSDILDVDFGLCAGFSYTLRRFNLLAYYDPTNITEQAIPDRASNPSEWFTFMKDKIDRIMRREIQIIPGFQNLREFTTDPEIAKYIKGAIVQEWAAVNVNFVQGIAQGLAGSKRMMKRPQQLKLRQQLLESLRLGYNPIVFLNKFHHKGEHFWIHVVPVTRVSELAEDGSFDISVWDINNSSPTYADSKVTFDPEGNMKFNYSALNSISPLAWDEIEIADMIKKNVNFCANHPGLCTHGEFKPEPPNCNELMGSVQN